MSGTRKPGVWEDEFVTAGSALDVWFNSLTFVFIGKTRDPFWLSVDMSQSPMSIFVPKKEGSDAVVSRTTPFPPSSGNGRDTVRTRGGCQEGRTLRPKPTDSDGAGVPMGYK